jgi:hypothetical protein
LLKLCLAREAGDGEFPAILRFALRRTLGHLCLGGRWVRRARRGLPHTHPAKTNIPAALKKGRAHKSAAIGHRIDESET